MKIKEHDCVVLTKNLPAENLEAGDVGTVVHIHKDGAAYEVEFVTLAGRHRGGGHRRSVGCASGWQAGHQPCARVAAGLRLPPCAPMNFPWPSSS